jgi:hypothetical protein
MVQTNQSYKFKKSTAYLFKNIKIIMLCALGYTLVILLDESHKPLYPLILFFTVSAIFLLVLIIRRYKYSSFIYIDSEKIMEGKSVIAWVEVSQAIFTLDRNGPYIDLKLKNRKYLIWPSEYENRKELRDAIYNICVAKGIKCIVQDLAGYSY